MTVEFWLQTTCTSGVSGNGCGAGTVANVESGNSGWEVDTGNQYTSPNGCNGCVYFKYGTGSAQNAANTAGVVSSGVWSYYAI